MNSNLNCFAPVRPHAVIGEGGSAATLAITVHLLLVLPGAHKGKELHLLLLLLFFFSKTLYYITITLFPVIFTITITYYYYPKSAEAGLHVTNS